MPPLNQISKEEWKPVVDYEGLYEVSSLGRVRSFQRGKTAIIQAFKNRRGYSRLALRKNGEQKNFLVHRLVARTFIPNPESKPHVNHIDNKPSNNKVTNLEWVTNMENVIHGIKYGYRTYGVGHGGSALSREDILKIRGIGKSKTLKELAEIYNTNIGSISKIINGISFKNIQ